MQAAVVFFILILMIYYSRGRLELAALQKMSFYAALFAAIYTVLSACEYIWANWAFIRKGLKK